MVTKSNRKPITVKQVGLASLILAIVGGTVGFYTGGFENMIIGFAEWFIAGFVLFVHCRKLRRIITTIDFSQLEIQLYICKNKYRVCTKN